MERKQKRLPKFERVPDQVASRQITGRSLQIIAAINRYRLISTSMLLPLIEGNQDVTYRHLQMLYHKSLVNRFAQPKPSGMPGEFIYFLDNSEDLRKLASNTGIEPDVLDFNAVESNQRKYQDGRYYFANHELMVTRFHWMLERACKQTGGRIVLTTFKQGAELYSSVETQHPYEEQLERIPHRPDAYFSLTNTNSGESSHFFYEADRKTSSTGRMIKKLRGYFHFIVKQRKHKELYNVPAIRAVIIETLDKPWAENLRQAACHPFVSGKKPSPLFWFTSSEFFTKAVDDAESSIKQAAKQAPYFLKNPEVVFNKLWFTPLSQVGDMPLSLLD